MTALPKLKYTVEEYIELVKNSDERFEYFNGEIVSMAGGKIAHSDISSNLIFELRDKLKDRPCRVFGGDTAVKTVKAWPFRLPDISVVCDEAVIEAIQGFDMLINPLLIAEVLSPSTENYDRDEKFLAYQAIESFKEYLLVHQKRPHITHYLRQSDGAWLRRDVIGLESQIVLESLGVTLKLSGIYWMVTFPESESPSVDSPQT